MIVHIGSLNLKTFTNHPKNPRYWEGFIYDQNALSHLRPEVIQAFMETIEAFSNCSYQEVNLKKLSGKILYSMRMNSADRILFATIIIANRPYALHLDTILNHDYQHASSLRANPAKLYAHLLNQAQHLAQDPEFPHSNEDFFAQTPDLPLDQEFNALSKQLRYHNGRYIALSAEQIRLNGIPFPCIIDGFAGTGKTLMILIYIEFLLQNLNHEPENTNHEIIYLCGNPHFLLEAQRQFEENLTIDTNKYPVLFLSYREFIERTFPSTRQKIVEEGYLDHWLLSYSKRTSNRVKLNKTQMDKIKASFHLIAGRPTQDIASRDKEILGSTEDFDVYLQVWRHYQEDLEKKNLFDIHHSLLPNAAYQNIIGEPYIFIDEAQGFNFAQTYNILRRSQHLCFSLDNQQILKYDFSIKTILRTSLENHYQNQRLTHIQLQGNYRCPSVVIDFCNLLLNLKYEITKGTADHYEYTQINCVEEEKPGQVLWIDPNSNLHFSLEEFINASAVVVTHQKFVTEAKAFFNTEFVFNFKEIGGFQAPKVYVYRPFDSKEFIEIDKILKEDLQNQEFRSNEAKISRPKNAAALQKYKKTFHEIYVACTRSCKDLIILQNNNIRSQLLTRLQHQKSQISETRENMLQESKIQNSLEAIKDTIIHLILRGNFQQAQFLYLNNPIDTATFTDFYKSVIDFHQSKANPSPPQKVPPPAESRAASSFVPALHSRSMAAACKSASFTELDFFLKDKLALDFLFEKKKDRYINWEFVTKTRERSVQLINLFTKGSNEASYDRDRIFMHAILCNSLIFIEEFLNLVDYEINENFLKEYIFKSSDEIFKLILNQFLKINPFIDAKYLSFSIREHQLSHALIIIQSMKISNLNISHLYLAIKEIHQQGITIIYLLLKHEAIKSIINASVNGYSLLFFALNNKKYQIVNLLLDAGAYDLNTQLIVKALEYRCDSVLFARILTANANAQEEISNPSAYLDNRDLLLQSPLSLAIEYNLPYHMALLLTFNASPLIWNSENSYISVLIFTIIQKRPELAHRLVKDFPYLVSKDDNPCLVYAISELYPIDFILRLISAGANLDAKLNNGMSAILWVTHEPFLKKQAQYARGIFAALLTSSCDINITCPLQEISALTNMIAAKELGWVQELLRRGAVIPENACSILAKAIFNGFPNEVILKLLDLGADRFIHYQLPIRGLEGNMTCYLAKTSKINYSVEVLNALEQARISIPEPKPDEKNLVLQRMSIFQDKRSNIDERKIGKDNLKESLAPLFYK